MARIRRARDGRYKVKLADVERELLSSAVEQMREVIDNPDPDDPVIARLFPDGYPTEHIERNAEWAILARSELAERRLAAIELARDGLSRDRLTGEELSALMRTINDVRLTLGTQLEVSEDMVPPRQDDPRFGSFVLYEWLGALLHEIVGALSSELD